MRPLDSDLAVFLGEVASILKRDKVASNFSISEAKRVKNTKRSAPGTQYTQQAYVDDEIPVERKIIERTGSYIAIAGMFLHYHSMHIQKEYPTYIEDTHIQAAANLHMDGEVIRFACGNVYMWIKPDPLHYDLLVPYFSVFGESVFLRENLREISPSATAEFIKTTIFPRCVQVENYRKRCYVEQMDKASALFELVRDNSFWYRSGSSITFWNPLRPIERIIFAVNQEGTTTDVKIQNFPNNKISQLLEKVDELLIEMGKEEVSTTPGETKIWEWNLDTVKKT